MQVSVENTTGLERRLTVELHRETLNQKINERLESLKDQVSIDGFRPGKVPLNVVQGKYGPQVQDEVFAEAINDSLQQALDQEKLEPVGKPVVEIDPTTPDTILRYSATFEIMPEVNLKPVDQIKLTRPVVDVADADIDKLIENLRHQRLTWKASDDAANSGDRVTIDYNGNIDGQDFPGSAAQNLPVVIGEGSMLPGFEDQLVGAKQGDELSINVDIPGTFPAEPFRGKTATFTVRVNQVEQAQLPELSDVFFRSFGVHEGGLTSFREQVGNSMRLELEQKKLVSIKTSMLEQLLELHDVTVPESLIQTEVERMKTASEENQAEQDADNDFEAQARYRVSCGIILTALARHLGLSATSDQIRNKIEYLAQTYENPDEVVAWYYSSQEQLASVESMVTEEMIVEHVLEHGQVTEKQMTFAEIMDT